MNGCRLRLVCGLAIAGFAGSVGVANAASCDAANQYVFNFSSRPAATLAYGNTYTYTATNGGGATQTFTVKITQTGMTSTQVNGNQMPAISTLVTGATTTARDLVVGGVYGSRTVTLGAGNTATVTFTFATPIRDFELLAHDVDYTFNQFRDWIKVSGSNGTNTYVPVLTTPTGSTVTIGPSTSPTLVAGQAVGNAAAGNNSDQGNLTATFAQPVTSVTFYHGNYPLMGSETSTGQQAIGIGGITFCPMPSLTTTKTSAPVAGSLGAFNLPGSDVIYTLGVTNSGGSTIDANTIVLSDVLPGTVSFSNAAFDGTTSLPVKVASGTGITLSAANIAYRKVGGTLFDYVPTAGYDPQVAEIRVTPTGQLAANSAFSIQFKARIN